MSGSTSPEPVQVVLGKGRVVDIERGTVGIVWDLDPTPPTGWADVFKTAHFGVQGPGAYAAQRPALEGNKIAWRVPEAALEAAQDAVRGLVGATNTRYAAQVQEAAQKRAAEMEKQKAASAAHQAKSDELNDRLRSS
jgi:hypothetical protein